MEQLFIKIRDALARNENLVLCSIIASSGSTPRGSGAKMALFADDSTYGTVGGGAVEYESVKLARQALERRTAFLHGFNLTKNQTANIGMICGGQVTVYFQFFAGGSEQELALFDHIVRLYHRRVNAWLITNITDGGVRGMGVYEQGAGLRYAQDIAESDVLPLLQSRAVLQMGTPAYYAEPLTRAGMVYVFGGGHVSQELVPVIARIGFSVVVFEDRAAFASTALFPTAVGTLVGDFTDIGAHVSITADDYVIIMTRGHQADFEVLNQALRTDANYIGVIGSRHKVAATNKRLLEAGIPESALVRIHTPIGLAISAETPAEIAISIAAELVQHRAALTEKV